MTYVPLKQLEQTGFWHVLAHVVDLSRNVDGKEMRERLGRGKYPEEIEPLLEAMKDLANGETDPIEDDPPPRRARKEPAKKAKRRRRPTQTHWRTDKALGEEPDFLPTVLLYLKEELPDSYRNDRSKKQKTLTELEDFLQDLIDKGLEYDDLTPKQSGLLGVIRRMHAKYHTEVLGDEDEDWPE